MSQITTVACHKMSISLSSFRHLKWQFLYGLWEFFLILERKDFTQHLCHLSYNVNPILHHVKRGFSVHTYGLWMDNGYIWDSRFYSLCLDYKKRRTRLATTHYHVQNSKKSNNKHTTKLKINNSFLYAQCHRRRRMSLLS